MLVWMLPAASGLRPMDSMAPRPTKPMPMPGPMAPIPMAMPAASLAAACTSNYLDLLVLFARRESPPIPRVSPLSPSGCAKGKSGRGSVHRVFSLIMLDVVGGGVEGEVG